MPYGIHQGQGAVQKPFLYLKMISSATNDLPLLSLMLHPPTIRVAGTCAASKDVTVVPLPKGIDLTIEVLNCDAGPRSLALVTTRVTGVVTMVPPGRT